MSDTYHTIYSRRDVRREFIGRAVANDVIARVLCAAHHAPSVGLSQPWRFLLIDDQAIKESVHTLFKQANAEAEMAFEGERRSLYSRLKLEGIIDAPLNVCISCDRRNNEPVLGRTHQNDTDLYSTVCAVQNFWLAAKEEQLGVGWVSIIDQQALAETLSLPDDVIPVAYLCVGYVSDFQDTPDLVRSGWSARQPLSEMVLRNAWNDDIGSELEASLERALEHRDTLLTR